MRSDQARIPQICRYPSTFRTLLQVINPGHTPVQEIALLADTKATGKRQLRSIVLHLVLPEDGRHPKGGSSNEKGYTDNTGWMGDLSQRDPRGGAGKRKLGEHRPGHSIGRMRSDNV